MKNSESGLLFTLSVSVGVAMIGLGIIWPLIPIYAQQMGAGGFMVGLIIASFNIARTLFSPFIGRYSDRLGRKNFIAAGLMAYALISVLYILPSHAVHLIGIRFIHGLASLLVIPIAMALVADTAPENEMGKHIGTLNMAVMAGIGIGPILGGIIRDWLGMNAAFSTMGLLALFTAVLVIRLVPPDPGKKEKTASQPVNSFKSIISHRTVMGICLMRFFSGSGQGAVYTFLPLLAVDLGLTVSQMGIVLGVNVFLIALLQRYCGGIADRVNPKYPVIFGTFATGLTVAAMPFVNGFFPILCLNILMGAANGFSNPAGLVIMGRLGKTMGMASLMSTTEAAWSLGLIVSPILSGIILDFFGITQVFVVGSLLILIGTLALTAFLWDYRTRANA